MREMSFNTQGSTTYLVLKLDPNEQLDTMAMGMITNNQIPGLLSVSPRRVNQDAYLYYSIASLTPLISAYSALSNDKRLLQFLRSFCRLVSECHDYLLDEDGLMLSPEHVYLQLASGEIQVPYLPLETGRGECSPYQFVRGLVMKVGGSFPTDSRLMPVLYRMVLSEEQFSLSQLDEQLAQLQTGGAVQADRTAQAQQPVQPVSPPPAQPVPPPARQSAPPVQPVTPLSQPGDRPPQAPPPEAAVEPDPAPQAEEKDFWHKKLFGSGKPAAEKNAKPAKAAKAGKEKPAKPAMSDFGFAIPNAGAAQETAEEAPAAATPTPPPPPPAKKGVFAGLGKKPQPSAPPQAAPPVQPQAPAQQPAAARPQPQPSAPQQQPVGQGYTYNLDGMDSGAPLATSPMMDMGTPGGPAPLYLVRRATGQQTQVTHSNFHIGRGQDLVDLFVDTAMPYMGVDHAYILIQGNEYFVVDNNSRNHTWLNGNMLEGSRPYPLQAGDKLRLADEYFDVVSFV